MSQLFPPPARQVIGQTSDGKPVTMNLEWYRYLAQQLFSRTGGFEAPTNTDISVAEAEDAGIEELRSEFFAARDGLAQQPRNEVVPLQPIDQQLAALRDELAELHKEVQALKQGVQL